MRRRAINSPTRRLLAGGAGGRQAEAGRLACFFKSVADGNNDPRWRTYLMQQPGQPGRRGRGRGNGNG